MGFDPVFFNEPRTYDELERYMYDSFISPDNVVEEKKESHQQFCDMLDFEKFKKFRRTYQAKFKPYRLDIAKIEQFIAMK